jgi:hypothetical protein
MQSGANGGDPTAGDIVQNMTDQVQAATQFAGNLDRLRQMGLSAELIQQIASGGASQGGGTAAALATANVDQIKQLNAMQSNLTTAANATGGAVADSMYGAGIDSAKGLIRGLQSQESAIEAQMLKIAESMKTAIKRALGIHSPSRVFHEIGQFITAGLKNGVDSSAGGPVGAVTNLATAVTNAGRSRAIPGGTSAGTGGTVVYQTNVTVQVAGSVRSDRDLRDVVQSEMLKLGARNSGTWVPYRRR